MPNPVFELFEVLCSELAGYPSRVIPEDGIDDGLMEDVRDHVGQPSGSTAFKHALEEVDEQFAARNAIVPYTVNVPTREFTVTDPEYVDFVAFARSNRGASGVAAKDFETRTVSRLRKRLTGDLRRVGVPRDRFKKLPEIVAYLETLGFEKKCLQKQDKDGGLDILWLPPLGAVPMRPVVSVQCKNGFFDEAEANASNGRAMRTLARHSHLKREQLRFVVFNDYIDESVIDRMAGCAFVPLGLADLASPRSSGIDDIL